MKIKISDWRYVWFCLVLGPLTAEAGLSASSWKWWAVILPVLFVYQMLPTPTPTPDPTP